MKKIYLSMLFFCILTLNVFGVDVKITMNNTSKTMTLTEKSSGTPVEVGTPTGVIYEFELDAAGTYVLNGFNTIGVSNGTLEIEVTEEAVQEFKITTITAYAGNKDLDKKEWMLGTDYDMECHATSREGVTRVITVSTTATVGKQTFLMNIGDSYRLNYSISSARVTEGFLATFNHSNTVTAASANAFINIPLGTTYSLTLPETANLYVGGKLGAIIPSSGGTHYIPFTEIIADSWTVADNKKTYVYTLGQNCVYNFRVSQTGKLTNGGIFTVPTTTGSSLEITQEDLDAADPKMIDHEVTHNSFANVGDILLNINKEGHLNLGMGQKRQLINLRSWQLTDNMVNNYFIEPDYHYEIVDVNGNEISNVISINAKGEIEAIGNGTAIVLITYDAIRLKIYSKTGVASNYMAGPLFTSIWPENTGTFVVTVGQTIDNSIVSNMKVQEINRIDNSDNTGTDLDSEHDVMYYLEGEAGYNYTFKPEGVTSVSVANPNLETNTSTYTDFTNVPDNGDGTYTMLLTYGRNIVKLTSASGASVYQVVSAKPAGYVISNKSRPGKAIFPGDDINIQFNGFFHPANKLSGIYNMSAYILYNNIPNGNSLILSANQYTFGGNPVAQLTQFHVPADADPTKPFELRNGAIQIKGYGSIIGKHRDISVVTGINPNFTASVRESYFGSIPDIDVTLATPVDGFKFAGMPNGAEIIVKDKVNDTIPANENGEYLGTYVPYSYEIYADGYKTVLGTTTIVENDGVKEIPITMTAITDTKWDGTSMTKPKQVTAEESAVVGSEFENKEGYYKIANAYELRWVAYQTEQKNSKINLILTADIDLNTFVWAPIGVAIASPYTGAFEGNYKTVKGLNINLGTNFPALIGYVLNGKVMNLTTEGEITKGKAAMIGGLAGEFYVENCHNKANVNGVQGSGGLVGIITNATGNAKIVNCSNSGNVNGGANMYVGGFIGQISSVATIENCWNTGSVTSTKANFGGFCGGMIAEATIKNCYNTGVVSANGTNVGGLVGFAQKGSITNCYNTGKITNVNTIGYGAIKGVGTDATVANCYAPDNIGENIKPDGTIIKGPIAFATGEVTWLLGSAFGQKIGTDLIPLLTTDLVYKVTYTNNLDAEIGTIYTNGVLPEIKKEGFLVAYLTEVDGDPTTEVTSDSELYVLFTETTAPSIPTELSGTPSETSIDLSWTASTDNVAVTGYNVYVDDVLKETVTGTCYTITDLTAATEYKVSVEAFDAAGNKSEKATITVSTIDKTAPSVPTELTGVPTETSIALTWTASTDNVGVTGYNVYVGDDLKGTITETNYTVTGLTVATAYSISVEAFDAAGNKSEKATVTISTIDATAPTAPTELAGVPTETSIALTWTASTDNVAVTGYNVYVNGELKGTATKTGYTVTGLTAATTYSVSVEAIDAAGNKSEKATINVSTIDATDLTAPSVPTELTGVPSETSIALTWTASTDNVAVTGYNVYIDDVLKKTVTETNYTVTGLTAATSYSISVETFDAAGNKSEKATINVSTIDETAPSVPTELTGVPSETSVALTWSASTDNVAVTGYNVFVNDVLTETVTETSYTVTDLTAATEYKVSVEAFDAAGNKSEKAMATVTTSNATGISSLKENTIKVYPNPFDSFIILETETAGNATIYDASGKLVLQVKIIIGANRINTSALGKGVYILKSGLNTVRIVK